MKRIIFFFLISCICGCTFFEDAGEEPSFFQIDNVSTLVSEGQGGNTHRITDVWGFADAQDLGVFELPAVVPVLPNAESTFLWMFAGIRKNGQLDNPIMYPFYERIELERNLQPLETEQLDLKFEYRSETKFGLVENFEGSNVFTFDADDNPDTELVWNNEQSSSGNSSGHIRITRDNPTVEVASAFPVALPIDGNAVYVEIDLKSDIETVIGLTGIDGNNEYTNFFIVLVPQPEWKKLYLSLGELLVRSGLETYRLVIGASISDQDVEEANIYVDNIKILHF